MPQTHQFMQFRISFTLLLLITLLSQCKVNKNSKPKNEVHKIYKEFTVNASRQKGEGAYQPSAKHINDILHTILDIRFNYEKQQVIGKATITIKPYFYPVSTLNLDAKSFELKRVAMIGKDTQNLSYTYDSSVIHINLGRTITNNETYKIFIDYIAKPNENKIKGSAAISDAKGIYFINPLRKDPDKPREIWTQGETQSNSGWFPTIDVPNEKMTHEIFITADEKDVTLSNGEMIYSHINPDKTHTDYWKQSLPSSVYLVMMAVGEFEIVKDSWRDSVDVNYYVEPAYKPYAKLIFGNTPEMLECFSKRLGVDYPWDKFSQVVVRDFVSGAMENTSAVVHFEGLNHDAREHLDNSYESIISHELFHHWFGDLVTCESWSNIPLNESFATYGSYLWDEYKYGRMEADDRFDENLSAYLAQRNKHKTNLIRYNYRNREDLFDVISYQKGSLVLHMLRKYVGDDAFFKSLQHYLTKHKFKTAEIHDLRLAFEEVTGEDLNWFFNQWFLGKGHPQLNISYKYDVEHKNVTMSVSQIQDSSIGTFQLPVEIAIYSGGKIKKETITISKQTEEFHFSSEKKIDLLNFDSEKMMLATINEIKPIEEYYFMFLHAPLFMDKSYACEKIIANMNDSLNTETMSCISYALNHEYSGIKKLALKIIERLSEQNKKLYADKIITVLRNDKSSTLRADAIELLKNIDAAKYKNEFLQATNDSSYHVVAVALKAINETDEELALNTANRFKKLNNGTIQVVCADLIASNAKGDQISYFENSFGKYGYSRFSILNSYGHYLSRSDSSIILKAIPGLKAYYLKIKDYDVYGKMMLKVIENNIAKVYETKMNEAEENLAKLKTNDPKIILLKLEIEHSKIMLEHIHSITSFE